MTPEKLEAFYKKLKRIDDKQTKLIGKRLELFRMMEADGIKCSLCAKHVKLEERGASYCPYGSFKPECYPKCFEEKG